MAQEKLFEHMVKEYLHSIGVYPADYPHQCMKAPIKGWYVKVWGGGFQKAGIPDILACVNGFMVAIEVKGATGKPSALQCHNVSRINKGGGIGVILWPQGFNTFKELMQEVMKCDTHIQPLNAIRRVHTDTKCVILTDWAQYIPPKRTTR